MEYYSGPAKYEFCKTCGEIMRKHVVIIGGHIICPDDWILLHPKKGEDDEIPQRRTRTRANGLLPG